MSRLSCTPNMLGKQLSPLAVITLPNLTANWIPAWSQPLPSSQLLPSSTALLGRALVLPAAPARSPPPLGHPLTPVAHGWPGTQLVFVVREGCIIMQTACEEPLDGFSPAERRRQALQVVKLHKQTKKASVGWSCFYAWGRRHCFCNYSPLLSGPQEMRQESGLASGEQTKCPAQEWCGQGTLWHCDITVPLPQGLPSPAWSQSSQCLGGDKSASIPNAPKIHIYN